jgi:signal transduction histidine kinase
VNGFRILLGLTLVESVLGDVWVETQSLALRALFLTAGAALFFPARRGARWLVDRLFYDDVTPYEDFVDSVQLGGMTADPADEIITGIAGRLVEALHLESAVLFLGTEPSNARLLTAVGPRAEEVVRRVYPGVTAQIQRSSYKDLLDLRWESDSLLVMALRSPGRQIGFAIMGPKRGGEVFVEEEKRLAQTVAPLLALAVDQSILSRELRDLNQRLVKAQEQERKRMAVDIHDGPLQKEIVLTRASEVSFQDPESLARELVNELREVCSRLRPAILDDLGIVSALEWLLEGVSNRSELSASLTLDGVDEDERLDPESELTLFRVTQEAINNTLKHADATRIDVSLSIDGDSLVLEARDDGTGFSLVHRLDGGIGGGGIGLSGMRERVIYLDGSLNIRSAPGRGTSVLARIPRTPVADSLEART